VTTALHYVTEKLPFCLTRDSAITKGPTISGTLHWKLITSLQMNYLQLANIKCTVLRLSPVKSIATLKLSLGSLKIAGNNAVYHDLKTRFKGN